MVASVATSFLGKVSFVGRVVFMYSHGPGVIWLGAHCTVGALQSMYEEKHHVRYATSRGGRIHFLSILLREIHLFLLFA